MAEIPPSRKSYIRFAGASHWPPGPALSFGLIYAVDSNGVVTLHDYRPDGSELFETATSAATNVPVLAQQPLQHRLALMRQIHANCAKPTQRRACDAVSRAQNATGTFNAQTGIRMGIRTPWLGLIALFAACCAPGQGTFVFDQQTSTDEGLPAYGEGGTMQAFTAPWGQSFTPTLSGIDFIRLMFNDGNLTDGLGAAIHLELLSGSISGTLIGTTPPITMPNQFRGTASFFFPSTVSLSPGVKYYFQPILDSGGTWNIESGSYFYPGGNAYNNGAISGGGQLWFREGIVVPEPSSVALVLLGGAVLALLRRRSPG